MEQEQLQPDDIQGRLERFLDQESVPERKEEPAAKPKEAAPEEEQTTSEPVKAEEPELAKPEGEEEASAEPETVEEPEPQEAEIRTFDDLAAVLEVEPEALRGHIRVTANGEEVTIGELIEAHGKVDETAQVQANETAVKAQVERFQAEHHQKLGELQAVTAAVLSQLDKDQEVNWDELKESDPVEYSKLRLERLDRDQAINGALAKMREEDARLSKEEDDVQLSKLYERKPEWKDAEVARPAMDNIEKFLTETHGFTAEEIRNIPDHRYIIIAEEAMKYRAGPKPGTKKETEKEAEKLRLLAGKKVGKLPRVLPGGAREEGTRNREGEKIGRLRQTLKRSGDERDAAKLIEVLL